jgi:alanine or glycine:cation symporter, AGCS family
MHASMTLDAFSQAIEFASNVVWSRPTMFLLLGTGIFLTLRLNFVQLRCLPEALRGAWPRASTGADGAISPLQAFMTALAASIGTGNIAGVATAVVAGGPGAVFWIWCYGFFATAIKFCEAVLGMRFRRIENGHVSAGPMHYLRDGLGLPWLGTLYAIVAGIAALVTTPMSQPNSMALVLNTQFGVSPLTSGIVIALLAALVVVGGLRSIAGAAERLSPLKVGLYLVGGLWVILYHAAELPHALGAIFEGAFSARAALGGTAGAGIMVAMRYGLARGIYANEAGYGTAAVVYGCARSDNPRQQGLSAVLEVFIVSFVTSSISALTILVTGVWRSGLNSTAAVAEAFGRAIPHGGWLVAVCVCLFGYTTLIGWAYYGEQFLESVAGRRIVMPYRLLYCALAIVGATSKVDVVWNWGDLMNGLQIFPNLVGVVGLSGIAAAIARGRGRAA